MRKMEATDRPIFTYLDVEVFRREEEWEAEGYQSPPEDPDGKGIEDALREAEAEQTKEREAVQEEPRLEGVEAARFENAETLWEEKNEPVLWLVEGLLPRNSQGWCSASPKGAKSILTTHLASCLASGVPFLGHYAIPEPRRVLLVQEEDPRSRLRMRLKQLVPEHEKAAWGGRFKILIEAGLRLDVDKWKTWLRKEIELHQADVIILDVWRWLHAADTNVEKELKPILSYLSALRRDLGVTVLVVTHDAKPKQGPEGTRSSVRITGNWSQWAWAHYGLFLRKVGASVQVEVESKDAPESEFAFRFEEGPDGSLALVWEPPSISEMDRRKRKAADYFQARPFERIDLDALVEVVGRSKDTVKKYMDALCTEPGFDGAKDGEGKTGKWVYWYSPPSV